jgi:hypothetical protein
MIRIRIIINNAIFYMLSVSLGIGNYSTVITSIYPMGGWSPPTPLERYP